MRSRYKPVHLHLGSIIKRDLAVAVAEPLPQRIVELLACLAAQEPHKANA